MVTVVVMLKESEQALIIALLLTWIHKLSISLSFFLLEISTKIRYKDKNLKKSNNMKEEHS